MTNPFAVLQFSLPEGAPLTPWSVLLSLSVGLVLCLVIAFTYRQTHRGLSYSVSFVHTLIIMGVTVAVIMEVIGTNIARAFTLVGALSIIRFRTAIKDPRDVAFVFMTMAVGMACGTGFYEIAAVFTAFMCPVVYSLYRFQIGQMPSSEVLVKVHVSENTDYGSVFDEVFFEYLQDHSLISVESVHGGTRIELVYSIHFKPGVQEHGFLNAMRDHNGNLKVALLKGQQNVNI